jgi:hypothetical protein
VAVVVLAVAVVAAVAVGICSELIKPFPLHKDWFCTTSTHT